MDLRTEFDQTTSSQYLTDENQASCQNCLLFEELAKALRISVGTLRNWKYLGTITPIHSISRRPHFRISMVREELKRKGKLTEGGTL